MSEETEPVRQANMTPSPRSGLTPPLEHRWTPGVAGNPKGRPSYKQKFEAAFGKAIEGRADQIVGALARIAEEGDPKMMQLILERVLPRLERHEIDAGAAPSRMVIEFAQPTTTDTKGNDDGDDG